MVRNASLSMVNKNRDFRIFEWLAYFMMNKARAKSATDIFIRLKQHLKIKINYDTTENAVRYLQTIFFPSRFLKAKLNNFKDQDCPNF